MTGYTKLFGSIVASTIWRESKETKIVWITMLALANKDGIVEASLPGLADLSRVSVEECEVAIAKLEAPDKHSRTQAHEGRRIQKVDGGWLVLNHAKYREKMNADERREYFRLKQQEHRAKLSKTCQTPSKTVKDTQNPSIRSTQSEAEAQSEAESECVPPNPPSREIPTEKQAIAMTMTCAIPEDFCRYVYADWSTREGRDGANCPVCWLPYVKKRWEREKMAWAAKTHNGNKEAKANGAVRSVMDLRTVLMAKETLATQIREKYSSNAAVGLNWNDETKRQEYRTLRREIGEITRQIAGMA